MDDTSGYNRILQASFSDSLLFIAQISFKEQNAPSVFGEFRVLDTSTSSVFAPVKPNSTVRFMLNNTTSRQLTE